MFDHLVDVLVVGSGGGGMTAALAADASGLDTLIVEKSSHFGGSTALSGGGIWVPGAPAQKREGYSPLRVMFSNTCARSPAPSQRRPLTAVRRGCSSDDGVPGADQSVVGVRVEARLRRLLP
ncbi:pyridine nucleotide-disulfide oxidoreductase family protein [Mycobacterium xenopi 3993]|nr:pyridine nucleotide-disulfide oxidoreductase family protein [Mycobacterium xenopi 3993]